MDIDFDTVVERKVQLIKQTQSLYQWISNNKLADCDYMIQSDNYNLISCDIRNTQGLNSLFTDLSIPSNYPTIVLAECFLIYLKNEDSEAILKWLAEYFESSPYMCMINYEMIEPFDSFGQTMINNLRDRGCDLLGIEGCPTV